MIWLSDIHDYQRLQQIWQDQGGDWSPYGRAPKIHSRTDLSPSAPQHPTPVTQHPPSNHPLTPSPSHPLTLPQAAALLAVSRGRIQDFIRDGKLTRQWIRTNTDHFHNKGRRISVLNLDEVQKLLAQREHQSWQRGIKPSEWNRDLRHPVIRTEIEAPPNDRLITVTEASEILDVCGGRVRQLITQGRLFSWQKNPGKQGDRIYLSQNQVWRYAHDPTRLHRRKAKLSIANCQLSIDNSNSQPSTLNSQLLYNEDWLESTGLHPLRTASKRPNIDRDFGEYFTTAQTAQLLGINKNAVHVLRRRGRLTGWQKPLNKEHGCGNRWWFYKKEDVYNLMADKEYRKRHRRAKRNPYTA